MKLLLVTSSLDDGGVARIVSEMTLLLPEKWDFDILLVHADDIRYQYRGNIIGLGVPEPKSRLNLLYALKVFLKKQKKLKALKQTKEYDACISFMDSSNVCNDGIHDSGCSLKVYRRECFEGVNLYGEQHRFIPAILKIKGFSVGEIVVNHRPRTAGKTKYNWKRTIKGFVDMVSIWFWEKFASRPLHLLGGLGFISVGIICGLWSLILFVQGRKMSNNIFPPLFTVFF